MAAATIHSVIPGWAGDQKRNRVILTAANTNDTVAPIAVGLKEITGVVLTNRAGTLDGVAGPVASVVAATLTSYTPSTDVLLCAAAKIEADFYGY